jgi:replicative DNA helicase
MIDPELSRIKAHPGALRLYASRVHLDKQGRDYFGLCPFHAEKSGSFSVSQGDDGSWLWCCFGGCGGGDVISFVRKTDNLPFKEALKVVQDFVGDATSRVDAVFRPVEPAPKTFKTYPLAQYEKLEDALMESQAGKDWLDTRGIGGGTAQRLHLGFRQDLGVHAGSKNKHIADKGWMAFPCIYGETVVGIKYRSIVEKAFARAPGMATELFNTETIDPLEPVWLVEGEPDACVLEQAGFSAVSLSSAGHILTPAQRDLLLAAEYIVLAGDNDGAAGVVAMARLKADFGGRALQIDWPTPHKDANDVFLKECKRDVAAFQTLCRDLVAVAKSQPMKGVYSLVDVMQKSVAGVTADNPSRFHWPWPSVDTMANFLPGDVALITATDTGMGKSQFVLEATVDTARKHNEVILNYQGEMSADEVANIVTANILQKDRNTLEPADYRRAAKMIGSMRYYVGADPSLTTAMPVLDLVEEAVKRFGITVLVIDHIHFICRNSTNEVQEQANAMQRIKNMTRQYGLKTIVVAQPRKADQRNEGKERQLSGVKGSETLVSDSSIVYFMHREVLTNIDPAHPPKDDYAPETTIRNKKARSKGTGNAFARLFFHGYKASFQELGLDNSLDKTA